MIIHTHNTCYKRGIDGPFYNKTWWNRCQKKVILIIACTFNTFVLPGKNNSFLKMANFDYCVINKLTITNIPATTINSGIQLTLNDTNKNKATNLSLLRTSIVQMTHKCSGGPQSSHQADGSSKAALVVPQETVIVTWLMYNRMRGLKQFDVWNCR